MDTMISKILIEYNGIDATEIIANDCDSYTWVDNANGKADTVTLNMRNAEMKWLNGYYPENEDTFKAWLQLSNWSKDYREGKIYCGCFMVDSLKYSGFPNTVSLSGISTPTNNNFNVKQKNRTWSKTTLRTILTDIAREAGITLSYNAEEISIDSINQSGKTDLSFAYSVCSEYGLAVKLYNNKIVVYDQTEYEKASAKYDINIKELGGSGSYVINKAVTTVYDSVKIQYTDGTKGDTLTYEYIVPGTMGKRQMFLSSKAESYSDAEKKAKAALRENIRKSVSITLKMTGSAKYLATDCFNLVGFGKMDGKYFIDTVTHSKSGGKYTISITAHKTVSDF